MERVYSSRYFETKDRKVIASLRFFKDHEDQMDKSAYLGIYKHFCTQVRINIMEDKVLSFVLKDEEDGSKTAYILVYEVPATDTNYFAHKVDEEGRFYIEGEFEIPEDQNKEDSTYAQFIDFVTKSEEAAG